MKSLNLSVTNGLLTPGVLQLTSVLTLQWNFPSNAGNYTSVYFGWLWPVQTSLV